jgi:hypothetical protein
LSYHPGPLLVCASAKNCFPMAGSNAPGLRESQLRGIVCNGLPPHANLLFSCASRAAVEDSRSRKHRLACKSRRMAIGSSPGGAFWANER